VAKTVYICLIREGGAVKDLKIIVLQLSLFFFFQTCHNQPDSDKHFKDQLIQAGKRCYDRGLFWGTGGDISVRIPDSDRFIIKGTGHCVGDLEYRKLSVVNLDDSLMNGPAPSHETAIHSAIYKLRQDVGAILHMHAPYATAWATAGLKVPAITQQSVTLLQDCGIVSYHPVGSEALTEAITELYSNPGTSVVLMENHGVFVVGKDLEDLLYKAETVENTARIAYLCKALGDPRDFVSQLTY